MASKKKRRMTDSGAQALANAIVLQAVEDYINALIQDDELKKSEVKSFLDDRNQWFYWLSNGMDGKIVMRMAENRVRKFINACLQHQPEYGNEEEAEEAAFQCPCCRGKVEIRFGGKPQGRGKAITRYYNYLCEGCHLNILIKDNNSEDRIPNVITKPKCEFCDHYKPGEFLNVRCYQCDRTDLCPEPKQCCKEWENTERWRNWLMQKKSSPCFAETVHTEVSLTAPRSAEHASIENV